MRQYKCSHKLKVIFSARNLNKFTAAKRIVDKFWSIQEVISTSLVVDNTCGSTINGDYKLNILQNKYSNGNHHLKHTSLTVHFVIMEKTKVLHWIVYYAV